MRGSGVADGVAVAHGPSSNPRLVARGPTALSGRAYRRLTHHLGAGLSSGLPAHSAAPRSTGASNGGQLGTVAGTHF